MDKSEFIIPLNGLPAGKTSTGSFVGKEFFEIFENTEILDAALQVSVVVEKSGQYIGVDCGISGSVTVACDRCLEPVELPVETQARLSVKSGSGEDDGDDDSSGRETVWLPDGNMDLDLAQVIYDYVCLALPPRRLHPDGGCNAEVLKYLESGISVKETESNRTSNPFEVLGGLFGN